MERVSEMPMSNPPSGGAQPDTSKLNGLQTTGRVYHDLSPVERTMRRDVDEAVLLRTGDHLLCDVYRP